MEDTLNNYLLNSNIIIPEIVDILDNISLNSFFRLFGDYQIIIYGSSILEHYQLDLYYQGLKLNYFSANTSLNNCRLFECAIVQKYYGNSGYLGD
jgi:hypothetical protein